MKAGVKQKAKVMCTFTSSRGKELTQRQPVSVSHRKLATCDRQEEQRTARYAAVSLSYYRRVAVSHTGKTELKCPQHTEEDTSQNQGEIRRFICG